MINFLINISIIKKNKYHSCKHKENIKNNTSYLKINIYVAHKRTRLISTKGGIALQSIIVNIVMQIPAVNKLKGHF